MKQFSSPMLHVGVDAGQIIKISLVTKVEDDLYQRDLWLQVETNEDALITIQGEDLEITNMWERIAHVVSETEEG